MTGASHDRIHDYVDGRLSDPERAEFERRMAADPALADRVERLRSIGRALRDEHPQLPPGFYTRARAVFEARRPQRRWFSLLSWETFGLAAATAMALAVFVPALLRNETPLPAPDVSAPSTLQQPVADDAIGQAAGEADETRGRGPAAPEKNERTSPPERKDVFAESQVAEEEPPRRRFADEPRAPAPVQAPPPTGGRIEKSASKETYEGADERRQAPAAPVTEAVGDADLGVARQAAAAASPLPPGSVEPGETREVDTLEWQRETRRSETSGFRARQSAPEAESDADRDDAGRWVLVGPRDRPFSCAAIRVERVGDSWVIRLTEAPAGSGDGHGCAVPLPDRGTPFRLEEAW